MPDAALLTRDRGDAATERARFFTSGEAFDIRHPPIPRHLFVDECRRALDPATPTGAIPLDLGDRLGLDWPATVPLILTRYLRIRAGERLETRFEATGEIYYVLSGRGESRRGGDRIAWSSGDVLLLPGGAETTHVAEAGDCVLWAVTNEPALRFEGLKAPDPATGRVRPTRFPAARVRTELDRLHAMPEAEQMAGFAIVFSTESMAASRNILPSLSLALNSLPPRRAQRAHRHNAVAVTLCLGDEGCWSSIEGERIDWVRNAVMVTPPGEVHSHHNDGDGLMMSLIVQDGGLHYHTRTMGFAYVDD